MSKGISTSKDPSSSDPSPAVAKGSPVVSRRRVLAGAGAAGLTLLLPRFARGDSHLWGELHDEAWPGEGAAALPASNGVTTGYKVLEIFVYGGLSPWETFYVDDPGWRGFHGSFATLRGACAADVPEEHAFLRQEGGLLVPKLGWPTSPLWWNGVATFESLLNRMRIVVLRHDLLPHEAAIPLNLSGLTLGNPRLAGSGAVIGQRTLAREPARTLPASCVLMPSGQVFAEDNFAAASAIGQMDASAAPLVLNIGPSSADLLAALARGGDAARATRRDALAAAYAQAYENRLSAPPPPPDGDRLRAATFDSYEVLRGQLGSASALREMLSEGPGLNPAETAPVCIGPDTTNVFKDHSQTALSVASFLLGQPGGPRYVGVIERGYREFNGAGYDAHEGCASAFGVDFRHMLEVLVAEIDAGRVDLDETLVVLTTEFGRTPARYGTGRNHHPYGYVSVLLGGPVGRGTDGRDIIGTLGGDGRAVADDSFAPADFRAAMYMAAGINPIQSQLFSISDLTVNARQSENDVLAQQNLARRFFGVGG